MELNEDVEEIRRRTEALPAKVEHSKVELAIELRLSESQLKIFYTTPHLRGCVHYDTQILMAFSP